MQEERKRQEGLLRVVGQSKPFRLHLLYVKKAGTRIHQSRRVMNTFGRIEQRECCLQRVELNKGTMRCLNWEQSPLFWAVGPLTPRLDGMCFRLRRAAVSHTNLIPAPPRRVTIAKSQ